MELTYSTLDTISNYEDLFREFHNYQELDKNKKLIYFTSGLGLSNSIHEKFIKSIIHEYNNLFRSLSNTRKEKIIRAYKTPNQIQNFINLLNLDLKEAFNLNLDKIREKYSHINSFESLISNISIQRGKRNDYLHGDFNFSDTIEDITFKENILDFQELHKFLFDLVRYSFYNDISNLPDLSQVELLSKNQGSSTID